MKKRWIPFIATCIVVALILGLRFGAQSESDRQAGMQVAQRRINTTVAVVNGDSGIMVNGSWYNYSAAIIDTLSEDFVLVSPAMAQTGFANGTYAAIVTFPSNVSARVLSFNAAWPERVQLEFEINPNLSERDYLETFIAITELQMAINTTLASTYVGSILRQFHYAQDHIGSVFQNNLADLLALEIITLGDFTANLELGDVPFVPIQPNELNTAFYMESVRGFAQEVANWYLHSYAMASSQFLWMRDGLIRLTDNFPAQEDAWLNMLMAWTSYSEFYGELLDIFFADVSTHEEELRAWYLENVLWNQALEAFQDGIIDWYDISSTWVWGADFWRMEYQDLLLSLEDYAQTMLMHHTNLENSLAPILEDLALWKSLLQEYESRLFYQFEAFQTMIEGYDYQLSIASTFIEYLTEWHTTLNSHHSILNQWQDDLTFGYADLYTWQKELHSAKGVVEVILETFVYGVDGLPEIPDELPHERFAALKLPNLNLGVTSGPALTAIWPTRTISGPGVYVGTASVIPERYFPEISEFEVDPPDLLNLVDTTRLENRVPFGIISPSIPPPALLTSIDIYIPIPTILPPVLPCLPYWLIPPVPPLPSYPTFATTSGSAMFVSFSNGSSCPPCPIITWLEAQWLLIVAQINNDLIDAMGSFKIDLEDYINTNIIIPLQNDYNRFDILARRLDRDARRLNRFANRLNTNHIIPTNNAINQLNEIIDYDINDFITYLNIRRDAINTFSIDLYENAYELRNFAQDLNAGATQVNNYANRLRTTADRLSGWYNNLKEDVEAMYDWLDETEAFYDDLADFYGLMQDTAPRLMYFHGSLVYFSEELYNTRLPVLPDSLNLDHLERPEVLNITIPDVLELPDAFVLSDWNDYISSPDEFYGAGIYSAFSFDSMTFTLVDVSYLERPPDFLDYHIPHIVGEHFMLMAERPESPLIEPPPRPDDFWASLDFMHEQLLSFNVDDFLSDDIHQRVEGSLRSYETFLDSIRHDINFLFDDNIWLMHDVNAEYNRFLNNLRSSAFAAAAYEQEALQAAIKAFIGIREINNENTIDRLGTFASMMPESRAIAGINQSLIDFTVMPFDFVPLTIRDEVVFEHPESMVVTFRRLQRVAFWVLGVVFSLTLVSIVISHFVKKKKANRATAYNK